MPGRKVCPEELEESQLRRRALSWHRARRSDARRRQHRRQPIEDREVHVLQEATSAYVAPPPPAQALMIVQEAQQHLRDNIPVPAGRVLPDGWVTNMVKVPVAPPLTGQEREDYIRNVRGTMAPELRSNPLYAVSSPYWDEDVAAEYEARRNSFFLPSGMSLPPTEWFTSDDESQAGDESNAALPTDSQPLEEDDIWAETQWHGVQAALQAEYRGDA